MAAEYTIGRSGAGIQLRPLTLANNTLANMSLQWDSSRGLENGALNPSPSSPSSNVPSVLSWSVELGPVDSATSGLEGLGRSSGEGSQPTLANVALVVAFVFKEMVPVNSGCLLQQAPT